MAVAARFGILILDDHPLFRHGLRQIIETDGGFKVVAEGSTGEEGLALIRQHKPDIVVLDINLPDMSGLDVAKSLQKDRFRGRVVILTMYNDEETFNRAMDLGVHGYVMKENAVTEIINCLKAVVSGEPYMTASLSKYLLRRRNSALRLAAERPSLEELTKAERRILRLVSQGKTNKEIAEILFISPRTVDAHRSNIRVKLNLKGDQGLLRFAIENQHAISQIAEA